MGIVICIISNMKNKLTVTKPSKSGIHIMMLQRFADKFAGESKAVLIDRLMEYYSNMPLPDLAGLYKEQFPI